MTKKLMAIMIVLLAILIAMMSTILWKNKDVHQEEHKQVEPSTTTESKQPVVEKKTYDTITPSSLTFIVNKKHPLKEEYEPSDLVKVSVPTNGKEIQLRKEANDQLDQLFQAAKEAGFSLRLGSGYRSYSYQKSLYSSYAQKIGKAETDKVSARPGYSEHQLGLAVDILGQDSTFDFSRKFETQPEAIWLKEHAPEYGFILRYPKGKESTTGYNFEPWHFRYLGKEIVKEIHDKSKELTLEEFFEVEGGDYAG